ncbi:MULTISPECIES: hypothetical protein [Corynebacterium]|uniref:hypothetical protein n=1 Tax=Corynebacterium TaxID=1716 RepID=UPI00143C6599|nr:MULTISPECIES: hypothetical protein [Corynebacterium]
MATIMLGRVRGCSGGFTRSWAGLLGEEELGCAGLLDDVELGCAGLLGEEELGCAGLLDDVELECAVDFIDDLCVSIKKRFC